MNLKNLLKFSTIVFLFTIMLSSLSYGQKYLNSTDGDDTYTGANPTNNPLGTGPVRTIEGAYSAFASGTTVYMAAGQYNYAGVGAISDANGYNFNPGPLSKSMTFVVQTYLGNNTVTLNGNGTFTLDAGSTGVIAFQPTTAGVQNVVLNPTVGQTMNLVSGTLDVSAMGAGGFTIGVNYTTINVTAGTIVGTPTFTKANRTLNYINAVSLTAGGEVPTELGTLNLSATATSKTVTFNNPINFGYVGGGIFRTTNTSGTFRGLVTLYDQDGETDLGTKQFTATIVNAGTGTFTFSGGVAVRSTLAANGTVIDNQSTGAIVISGPVTYTQFDAAAAGYGVASANSAHTSLFLNSGGTTGTLSLTGGVSQVNTGDTFDTGAGTSDYTTGSGGGFTPILNVQNGSTGTMNLGGTSVVTTISGGLTTAAAAGTVNVKGPVTIAGALINNAGHTIALAANTLTLTLSGAAVHTNEGNITSSAIGSGLLVFNVSGATTLRETAGTGNIPNLQKDGAGLLTLKGVTVNGNITSNKGGITLSPWTGTDVTVTGLLTINTPATGTNVVTSAPGTTFYAGVNMSGGQLTLPASSTTRVTKDYTQNGGILLYTADASLDIKANFIRNAGTVTPASGLLRFSGGIAQTFSGGTNLQVYNFSTSVTNTNVTFINGSLEVLNTVTIISNTTVNVGTYNIRMLGNGTAFPTFGNQGSLLSSGGGGVIFLGPTSGQLSISGNGTNTNIEVRLTNPANFVDVTNTTNGQVNFSGILTLSSGTIRINAGNSFNPSNLITTPTIRRNMGNTLGGAPDGQPINLNTGLFNITNTLYNLEYFSTGTVGATYNVGPEFVIGATPYVINLTISATTGAVNFPAAGLYQFTGNLTVANSATATLAGVSGTDDLVSTGSSAVHSVKGTINGTAQFLLTGDGTLTGGLATAAPADASAITTMTINTATTSATYTITNLKAITTLNVVAGIVNLGMGTWSSGTLGTVANFNLTGGSVDLTADANVSTSFAMATGATFDFNNQNLYVTGGTFGTVAGGTFLATGATTKGWLMFKASAGLNTGTVLVPKIQIQNGSTVTLGGNSGVSDTFQDYDATPTAGVFAMGANTFTLGGGTWNTMGGTYSGTGTTIVTGATNINLGASLIVPNFQLKNTTNTATLVNNTGISTPPSLTTGSFTSTSGTLALGAQDVIINGTAGFTFVAGTFTATTSNTITATDNANGEFVFDNVAAQALSTTATGLVFPNVRVNNTGSLTLAGSPNNNIFTVANRLVLANTGDVTAATTKLVIGDGALIKRMNNAGILSALPTFAGVVDVQYTATAAITPALEMPGTATTPLSVRNLYVNNTAAIPVNASKPVTVTGTLYLYTGDYDFEATAGTIYGITMGAASTVNVRDGNLLNSGSTTVTGLAGGPVTLTYSNTAYRLITSREYPATAAFVSVLNVNSNTGATTVGLKLHADRSCGDFVLASGNSTTPINDVRFDLNGKTLSVTNATSATLTRGILSSETNPTAPATSNVAGTLTVTGTLTSAAAASIINVNVTAATMTLAGPFTQALYGTATTTSYTSATATNASSVAGFKGNITSADNLTLNGAYTGGTITASKDVTMATGSSMNALTNLVFTGTANATFTIPSAGATVGALTFSKTNNTNTVTLAGGNLASTANTTFVNGLFVTGANTFNMVVPAFGGGQGFTRTGVTGTNISHVVGNVAKTLFNAGGPGLAGSSEPRQVFPVGTMTKYRMAAVTFNPAFGLPTTPNTTITVNAVDGNPGGAVGLPIKDGVATGIDVARYPNFYWTVSTSPSDIGPSTPFDLELSAQDFTTFDAIGNVRLIRRHGAVADVSNSWLLQGVNTSYDNSMNATTPTIIQRGANAGLRAGGAVFTFGMSSNLSVKNAIAKQWLVIPQGAKLVSLANVFQGNIGTLSFTAQSSNIAVATAEIVGSSVKLTPLTIGEAVITVTAVDAANNDFFAYSFSVDSRNTDVATTEEIPTEFALMQNFPNPFNPTTNIKFALPKESNVTLKIYNILGEEVANLVNKVMPAGYHTVNFDATKLASGMYIYRIEAGSFVQVKKMLLMK
ncbi:MAG: T9SS type A sorting domain-containing protein [Ignavibacteriales bacterium]|nr:T9SS type A sorting domain-containing protein [Ignavibacteriales bacterium]